LPLISKGLQVTTLHADSLCGQILWEPILWE